MREPERAYVLARAYGMREASDTIKNYAAATGAEIPEETKRKRLEAAPECLKRRVEDDKALPEVQIRVFGQEEGHQGEVLQAAVSLELWDLKPDLLAELLEFIRPKWSKGKASWEEAVKPTVEISTTAKKVDRATCMVM